MRLILPMFAGTVRQTPKKKAPLRSSSSFAASALLPQTVLNADTLSLSSKQPRFGALTPLHEAAMDGDAPSLRRHIRSGADINEQEDEEGETPLHTATIEKQYGIVRILLGQPGINWTKKNHDGESAYDIAKQQGDEKMLREFKRRLGGA